MSNYTLARHRYCPPTVADFPTIVGTNSENPVLTNTTGRGLNMLFGNNPASGYNVRGAFKTINAASSQSIIARFEWPGWGFDYVGAGLMVYDGTKFVTFAMGFGQNQSYYEVGQWTNSTTNSSFPYNPSDYCGGNMEWMRMDVVGGALTNFFVGCNGKDWLELYSSSQSSYITPTKVGFGIYLEKNGGVFPPTGTNLSFVNCLYYSDPDIVPAV